MSTGQRKHAFVLLVLSFWLLPAPEEILPNRSPAWAGSDGTKARPPEPIPAPKPAPTVGAKATHSSESHYRFGVAALVLPNVRGNKEKALQRIETHTRRA